VPGSRWIPVVCQPQATDFTAIILLIIAPAACGRIFALTTARSREGVARALFPPALGFAAPVRPKAIRQSFGAM
jgi:hypothetical protein